MTLGEMLIAVWQQALEEGNTAVELNNERYRVTKTCSKRLKTVRFSYGEYEIDGIEQNPNTTSRWAALAREGTRIMQFSFQGRYMANVAEGKLLRYPAWERFGDHRLLDDAPGHLFLEYEADDLASFLQLSMLNGWGGYVLTHANYANAFSSHDEYSDFYSDNQDMLTEDRKALGTDEATTK
jgi:hypothetical protein